MEVTRFHKPQWRYEKESFKYIGGGGNVDEVDARGPDKSISLALSCHEGNPRNTRDK